MYTWYFNLILCVNFSCLAHISTLDFTAQLGIICSRRKCLDCLVLLSRNNFRCAPVPSIIISSMFSDYFFLHFSYHFIGKTIFWVSIKFNNFQYFYSSVLFCLCFTLLILITNAHCNKKINAAKMSRILFLLELFDLHFLRGW